MIALLVQQGLHERAGYGIESDIVARRLGTDRATGLTAPEAARRLTVDGPNELAEAASRNVWAVAWKQATATMVMILIVPVTILATLGDYIDAAVIVTFVGVNAVIGCRHAFRAEKANVVLKRLAVPRVRVRRDGGLREIAAREVVVGDMMLLEAGNAVAADGLLMDAESLRTQEAALTGELRPVDKAPATSQAQAVRTSAAVGDHSNMVFMGTTVTHGCGHAVVTDTGMRTQMGRIAKMSPTVQRVPISVQPRLAHLGRRLAFVALVWLIFVLGLVRGDPGVILLAAVSSAEAAVPEGILAVVTIALTLGGRRMLRCCTSTRGAQAVASPR